jgi:hypothetical protein
MEDSHKLGIYVLKDNDGQWVIDIRSYKTLSTRPLIKALVLLF